MSSKQKFSSNGIKDRLKSATNGSNDPLFNNNFNMSNIQGDTGIHYVSLSSLSPAPDEWNFYKPLSDQKMTELIDSILSKGLLHPIVVWQKDEVSYMILAGHNRVKAYQYIYGSSKDAAYEKIPALIKEKDSITEDEAREIIVDTNWVQRSLSPLEKSHSIAVKYAILQKKSEYKSSYGTYGEGEIREKIARDYEISGRQINELKRLSKLLPSFKEKLAKNEISYSVGAKIALFDDDVQQWLLDFHSDRLTSKYTRKFNSSMTKKDLEMMLSLEPPQKTISFKVSKDAADLFLGLSSDDRNALAKLAEGWIKEKNTTEKTETAEA